MPGATIQALNPMDNRDDLPGHPVLNPDGIEIRLPSWAFPKLRSLGLLRHNATAHRSQITDQVYVRLMEVRTPPQSAQAINYEIRMNGGGRPHDSGIPNSLANLLGKDCSGPKLVICHCRNCSGLKQPIIYKPKRERNKRGGYAGAPKVTVFHGERRYSA